MNKLPYVVGGVILFILIIILIVLGLFDGWVFFGMIFYVGLFFGGYFFIITGRQNDKIQEMYNNQRRQKFEWCFNKVNEALRNMPGGQGIEWDSGFGRVSDFKTFNDGTQNKPFRSILGYLSGSQQLVLVIYDIDNDDIVKFEADPSPDVIQNHFYGFNPFKKDYGGGGESLGGYSYDKYGRLRTPSSRARKGMSIHISDDDVDNQPHDPERATSYEDLKTKPEKGTVDDVFKKMNK